MCVDDGEDGAGGGGVVNPLTALVPFDCNVGAASVSGGGGGAHVGERPGLVWDSRSAGLFIFSLFFSIIYCGKEAWDGVGFAQRWSRLLSSL